MLRQSYKLMILGKHLSMPTTWKSKNIFVKFFFTEKFHHCSNIHVCFYQVVTVLSSFYSFIFFFFISSPYVFSSFEFLICGSFSFFGKNSCLFLFEQKRFVLLLFLLRWLVTKKKKKTLNEQFFIREIENSKMQKLLFVCFPSNYSWKKHKLTCMYCRSQKSSMKWI